MTDRESRRTERLVVLVFIATLVFNYPLLELFSGRELLFGIPILYFFLFASWAFIIACIGLTMIEGRGEDSGRHSNSK